MDYFWGITGYIYLEFLLCMIVRLFERNGNMDETLKSILAAGVTVGIPLVGGLIALIRENGKLKKLIDRLGIDSDDLTLSKQLGVSSKSLTEQLGVESKSLTEQLGVGSDDKSITSQLGINSKSITEQLGVGSDDKSITAQHREIYDAISNIYGILHDNQVRQDAENTSQANLAATMEAFQQSYVSLINENAALRSENLSLKSERSLLLNQVEDLQAHLNETENNDDDESMNR